MNKHTNRMDTHTVIRPGEGRPFAFGDVSGSFKIDGAATGGRFSVAQLPKLPPRTLAAPLHRHTHEDEFTYVLEGTLAAMVGKEAITAEAGTWIIKPRGQWHTFWNPDATPCSIIEIVSPAGFERYFDEVAATQGDLEQLARVNERYAIDMDFTSVPELCERHHLRFPAMGES